MKRIVYRLVGAVVFLLVLPSLLILALLPSEYSVKETIEIEADPDTIHEMVRDLKNWEKWNPWTTKIRGGEISYSDRTRSTGDSLVYLLPAGGPYGDDLTPEQIDEREKEPREAFWKRQTELRALIVEIDGKIQANETELREISTSTKAAANELLRPVLEYLRDNASSLVTEEEDASKLASTASEALKSTDSDDLRDRISSFRRQLQFLSVWPGEVSDSSKVEAGMSALEASIELTEAKLTRVLELLVETKELEDKLQATRDTRRYHYADRTSVSVLLGSVRVARMDLRLTKVMEALEAEPVGRIPRTRFEELIRSTGVEQAAIPEIEDEMFDRGLMRVIRNQDRLTVSPSMRIRPVSREALGVFLSIADSWKRGSVSKDRAVSMLSQYRLRELGIDKGEFEAAIDRLVALGAITLDEDIVRFTGHENPPELDATTLRVLAELVVQDGWRWPIYAMDAMWLSKQDAAKVNPLLDELERANVIERRISGDQEQIELTRDDGVGFRAVYGGQGRMESTHRIYYRITGEGRKTRVTWHIVGKFGANPIHRIVGTGAPSALRPDMQEALKRLKVAAEEYQKQVDLEEDEDW